MNKLTAFIFAFLFLIAEPFALSPFQSIKSVNTQNVGENSKLVVDRVYVKGVMDLKVVQQPSGEYVDDAPNAATQFMLALNRGNIGLLAHNYKAGKEYFKIKKDSLILVHFSDGSFGLFRVDRFKDYRKVEKDGVVYYIDIESGEWRLVQEVIDEVYKPGELTLQTCISVLADLRWGLHFVIAKDAFKPTGSYPRIDE